MRFMEKEDKRSSAHRFLAVTNFSKCLYDHRICVLMPLAVGSELVMRG